MSTPVRAFYLYSESWYGPEQLANSNILDEVTFGIFYPEGTTGEMNVTWTELGGRPSPQLQCYDDGWRVLASFTDVLTAMGEVDGEGITPKEFCELLLRCGFIDKTKRESLYVSKKAKKNLK